MSEKKAILVVGVGDATGGAIARRFAREGYVACVTRRSEEKLQPLVAGIRKSGGEAHGFGSDGLLSAFPGRQNEKGLDGLLFIDAIVETYWQLHMQRRSAWTHELDVRPWSEAF